MNAIESARNLAVQFATELNRSAVDAQNWSPLTENDDLPEFDYVTLRQQFGTVTRGMERAYRDAFNETFVPYEANKMKIVETDFASIEGEDGERIFLSLASELDSEGEKWFFIVSDSGEDTGPREKTKSAAKANAEIMWGSPQGLWDLQYH